MWIMSSYMETSMKKYTWSFHYASMLTAKIVFASFNNLFMTPSKLGDHGLQNFLIPMIIICQVITIFYLFLKYVGTCSPDLCRWYCANWKQIWGNYPHHHSLGPTLENQEFKWSHVLYGFWSSYEQNRYSP